MGYEYVWIDTCCIDKTSSAELSEAINSMFAWYQEAKVCYAYLFDVPDRPLKASRWFTRGWTLQELIAPREVIFYDGNWRNLGDRTSLGPRISQCTRIPESILSGEKDLDTFSTAQRMSWAAERQTTRVEDRAYCLMGLFGVNMPLIYGEREAAFIRLQEEILRISEDHSLFAWKSSDTRAGLLATSPAAFIDSHDIVPCETFETFSSPLIISGKGIHLDLCFIGLERVGLGLAVLQCKKTDGESTSVAIFVRDSSLTYELERFERVYCDDFRHLDLKMYHTHQYRMTRMCIRSGRITRFKMPRCSEEFNNLAPPHIYPDPEPPRAIDRCSPKVETYLWLLLTQSNPEAALNAVSDGYTPLSWASEKGLENFVSALLKRGAATEVKREAAGTPLFLAAQYGHTATVKLLLDKGASTRASGPSGRTPLSYCSYAGQKDMVRLLIEKGADVNGKGLNGETPLISAIHAGSALIVKILIDKGADVNLKDVRGRTPLSQATLLGNFYIARLLVDKGADINRKNADGGTPLNTAIFYERMDIVNMLLEKGAQIDKAHKHSQPALSCTNDIGNPAILDQLKETQETMVMLARKLQQAIPKFSKSQP